MEVRLRYQISVFIFEGTFVKVALRIL